MRKRADIIKNHKVIGVCNDFGGIEVIEIEHSFDDYVHLIEGVQTSNPSYHRLKIYFDDNKDSSYFVLHGQRIYFDNIMRVNY